MQCIRSIVDSQLVLLAVDAELATSNAVGTASNYGSKVRSALNGLQTSTDTGLFGIILISR